MWVIARKSKALGKLEKMGEDAGVWKTSLVIKVISFVLFPRPSTILEANGIGKESLKAKKRHDKVRYQFDGPDGT